MPSGFLGGGIGPVALKRRAAASDWWQVAGQTCVAAYQPIGAASLAASYVNLANPGTYDAAPGVAPTLVAGGWQRDNNNQYLNTGIVPLARTWSYIIRYSDANTTNAYLFGCYTDPKGILWRPNHSPASAWNGSSLLHGQQRAAAVVAIANDTAYVDGIAVAGTIPAGTGIPNLPLFVLSPNFDSVALVTSARWIIAAFAVYSTTLSAADVAALTTRMQALA